MKKQQGFALEMALFLTIIFLVVSTIAIKVANEKFRQGFVRSEADNIRIVLKAATDYATTNKTALQNGTVIMYVNNQLAPTITELQNLGFLVGNGTDLSNPLKTGGTWQINLSVQANKAIKGTVILNGSILNSKGQLDQPHACSIAMSLGDQGVCSLPGSATLLGNVSGTVANPTGKLAIVGGLISIAP